LIPPDFIDELLARTDIVEIIESRVQLKKTGANYSGLCPFHTEKSPSFSVSPDKQFYYCFGCQASGSAIKFIMEYDRLDFLATVEHLAGRAGMDIPKSNDGEAPEKQQKRKSIYQILEQSADYFKDQLRVHDERQAAVGYLKGRGLTGEIARDFGLGFAPSGWDNLHRHIAKTNQEHQLLIDAGMVIKKEEEGKKERTYDRFRERIMFPIRDLRGRVIAFGGRIIGDGKPKYLNSPETQVFHKGRELYGLYEARQRERKLTRLLVVEGYMDVVALAQHGVNYSIATLGTATTPEHLDRIFRQVTTVIFCFDGDTAGINAAWKALLTALPLMKDGRSARFLFLPHGEDPDSLIRKEGKVEFELRLDQAPHLSNYFFDHLKEESDTSSLDGKAQLSKIALPLIMKIPNGVFRELMISQLAEITNLTAEKLISLNQIEPAHSSSRGASRSSSSSAPRGNEVEQNMPDSTEFPDFADTDGYPPDEEGYSYDEYDDHSLIDHTDAVLGKTHALAEKALALLVKQPELISLEADSDYGFLEVTQGCGLLLEVIRLLIAEDIRSPNLLLHRFQDRTEFALLKGLAEQEQLLSVDNSPAEFKGILSRLQSIHNVDSVQSRARDLHRKSPQDMTEEEKQQLRESIKSPRK
jgi:DNA primase